jgi:hypothetical protein
MANFFAHHHSRSGMRLALRWGQLGARASSECCLQCGKTAVWKTSRFGGVHDTKGRLIEAYAPPIYG